MNSLVDELFPRIFNELSIYDLLSCSLVCKRLNRLVRKFRVKELIIDNDEGIIDVWFYTNKLPNYDYCLFEDSNFRFLETNLLDLKHLRSLRIQLTKRQKKFRLETLNSFQRLIELDLKLLDYIGEDIIELNELEILSLQLVNSTFAEVNASKLFALCLNYYYEDEVFNPVRFKYPETVIYFKTAGSPRNLEEFKSVEYFKTGCTVPSNIFNIFPKIKEIHSMCIQEYPEPPSYYSYLIENLDQILFKRTYFNKNDIRLYMFGFRCIEKSPKINEFEICRSLPVLQLNKYDLLEANLSWMKEIDYCEIKDHINKLPANWFDKFSNVHTLIVNEIESQNDLMRFLKNLRNLNVLKISTYDHKIKQEFNLNQQFYDFLPTIKTLTIIHLFIDSHKEINLHFIIRIRLLKLFETNQKLKRDQVLEYFTKLRHLKTVSTKNLVFNMKNGYLSKCRKDKSLKKIIRSFFDDNI